MTADQPSSARTWDYRFLLPGEIEIERRQFDGDDAAERWGHELSHQRNSPIVIQRHSAHVDDWEYLIEVG